MTGTVATGAGGPPGGSAPPGPGDGGLEIRGLDAEQARILTRVKELDGVPGASDEIGPLAARLREIQALIREVR